MIKVNHWSGGVVLRRNGKTVEILLVCEPSSLSELKEGYRWSLPGGKCCNRGLEERKMVNCCAETPEQTLIREFKEETGYDIAPVRLFGKESRDIHDRYVFVARIVGGEPLHKTVPGDKESPAWFPLNKIPRNTLNSHQRIIRTYIASRITAARGQA